MFSVEMLPAEYGDCLWITYGQDQERYRVLIDGGTGGSADFLTRRISNLEKDERHFELFVITHIDSDHIGGALELLRSVKKLGVTFGDVWFNGWQQLDSFHLSPMEGEWLADNIQKQNLNWNDAFGGAAVVVPDTGNLPTRQLRGELKLTVLSPLSANLDKLRKRWQKVLTEAYLTPGQVKDKSEPEGLLLSDEPLPDVNKLAGTDFKRDSAVANGSSIALLAEFENKRCLLAGDAFAPVMTASLKRLLESEQRQKIKLEAFKLSHHGSKGNTSKELLELVECSRYLFSSNGKRFSHPDPESVARVIKFGGPSPCLYFNYHTKFNEMWDNNDLIEDFDYRVEFCQKTAEGSLLVEL